MIGLGIDLCEVARMEAAMAKSDGFLRRFFTEEERAYIAGRGAVGAQSAAAIFAAKEAFLKAVGVGLGGGIALTEIGVVHDAGGAPRYALAGAAAEKLRELGGERVFLSLSHEAGIAAAVAVAE